MKGHDQNRCLQCGITLAMAMKNRYAKNSKISEAKILELIRLFSLNLAATQIAVITGLNRNTVNRFTKAIRVRIAEYCESQSPLSGEVEVDESFFGARRVKGKRGRGAFGKTIFKALFVERWLWRASSTPTAGEAIMASLTSDMGNTFGWIMEKTSLFLVPPISMELKDSGDSPNPV